MPLMLQCSHPRAVRGGMAHGAVKQSSRSDRRLPTIRTFPCFQVTGHPSFILDSLDFETDALRAFCPRAPGRTLPPSSSCTKFNLAPAGSWPPGIISSYPLLPYKGTDTKTMRLTGALSAVGAALCAAQIVSSVGYNICFSLAILKTKATDETHG